MRVARPMQYLREYCHNFLLFLEMFPLIFFIMIGCHRFLLTFLIDCMSDLFLLIFLIDYMSDLFLLILRI